MPDDPKVKVTRFDAHFDKDSGGLIEFFVPDRWRLRKSRCDAAEWGVMRQLSRRRGALRRILIVALGATASGCAATHIGGDLSAGSVPEALQQIAIRAKAGDKQAQLELGIRYEEGRGVERDLRHAGKLYSAAARDEGGRMWVYSPGVGNVPGRVLAVDRGVKIGGIPEARARLERLKARWAK